MRFPAGAWEFEAVASMSLLVLFSSVRKAPIFSFVKERTHAFLYRKKSIKRTASVPLDRSCGRQRFDGGYERRRPRSRGSRDPSIAAPVLNIVPRGAHTALALCLRARSFQSHRASARRVVACASFASTATPSSRGYVLPSRRMRARDSVSATLFVVFSSVRKRHLYSPLERRNVFFSCAYKKRTKRSRKPAA